MARMDAYQHFDIIITALRRCRSDIAGVSAENARTTKCRVIPKHFPAYYVATRSLVASTVLHVLQTLLVGCCLLARYRSRRSVSVSQSVKRKKQDDENDTHPTLHVLLASTVCVIPVQKEIRSSFMYRYFCSVGQHMHRSFSSLPRTTFYTVFFAASTTTQREPLQFAACLRLPSLISLYTPRGELACPTLPQSLRCMPWNQPLLISA